MKNGHNSEISFMGPWEDFTIFGFYRPCTCAEPMLSLGAHGDLFIPQQKFLSGFENFDHK